MKKNEVALLLLIFTLSGCVVRTYEVTKDRIDQDLTSGNRGYLKGDAPYGAETKERKSTRTMQTVEVEFHSPIRFEKGPKVSPERETLPMQPVERTEDSQVWGNRGFITQSYTPEIEESTGVSGAVNMEKYTVQKNDTLQKIAQKFYGSSKKWSKIYEANTGVLRGPDKIYPGQVINIPVEASKETEENLK